MQAALPCLLAARADVKFEEMPIESIRKLLELFWQLWLLVMTYSKACPPQFISLRSYG